MIGILAHADAGKTTLVEAMLYRAGKIKKLGRVDHRDSYLDTHWLERERGITIFSKQARFTLPHTSVTLLDTPGHADFSAETERCLSVLDCAVLVISGTDGVQAHTETLWRLLEQYQVPCFVFVSKMDLPGPGETALTAQLQKRLGDKCLNFSRQDEAFWEGLALRSEQAMERYLENGCLEQREIAGLIAGRELVPCLFGSGLKLDGVDALLDALDRYAPVPQPREDFAARVFQIGRDTQGQRLSYLRLTGGSLRVRMPLRYRDERGEEREEKCTQLRLYSGTKYETVETVEAGEICAVLGLSATWPGQGLGGEPDAAPRLLEPVVSYRLGLPQGVDAAQLLPKLQLLDEEDPQLHVDWDAAQRQISVRLMGKVQAEVFKRLVRDRFDVELTLDRGRILYRETIADTVEGVGHFEPLRHYAEVHLLLEPLPPGSGIVLDSTCPEDELDRNWQRLILSNLQEKQHLGVLTASPITDIKITLCAGKAHLKHTEGGDFRQAAWRAVRQGLMQARSVLLEPWYAFSLEVPAEQIGRAISDIRSMDGSFDSPEELQDGMLCLKGSAPVAGLGEYQTELLAYTHGRGRISLQPDGYRPCSRQQELVESMGYDPERDPENTADSVFCAHGAGFLVKWDQVPAYMHLETCLPGTKDDPEPAVHRSISIDQRELEAIMEREFGPIRRRSYSAPVRNEAPEAPPPTEQKQQYLIVDGYNLIFAWEELKALAAEQLDLARSRLMDMLSSYCAYTRAELVLVFDGYRRPGNPGQRSEYHNIHVAFTKDGETGDAYIERLVGEIGRNYAVRVITSDNLIRLSALRSGVLRSSSTEFAVEVQDVLARIRTVLEDSNRNAHKTRLKDGKS